MLRNLCWTLVFALVVCGSSAAEASAHAGGKGSFSCRASSVRVSLATSLVFSEPQVANEAGSPCEDDARSGPSGGVPGLVSLALLNANTNTDPGGVAGGQADASVASAVVTVGGLRIKTGLLRSQADSFCTRENHNPGLIGSSRVAYVRINGGPPLDIGSGPVKIPLGLVTLYVNRKTVAGGVITQRALELRGPGGASVVLAEAVAGVERCEQPDGPPTAVLELETAPISPDEDGPAGSCYAGQHPDLFCFYEDPRSVWTRFTTGTVYFGFCADNQCQPDDTFSFSFRGTISTDPGDDIASWSIDFGDGTSTGIQDWATAPPTTITHAYDLNDFNDNFVVVTLTVTDAAGESDSEAMPLALISLNDI